MSIIGLDARSLKLLCAIVLLALVSACASLQQSVETPELSLTGLKLIEAGFTRQRYDLTLNVRNPNSIPLPIRGMSYRVRLAGEKFAEGETLKAFTIPANGEIDFNLSVSTDLLRTIASLQRMLDSGDKVLKYDLGGQLEVDLPFVRALPFSKTGEVDLTQPLRY